LVKFNQIQSNSIKRCQKQLTEGSIQNRNANRGNFDTKEVLRLNSIKPIQLPYQKDDLISINGVDELSEEFITQLREITNNNKCKWFCFCDNKKEGSKISERMEHYWGQKAFAGGKCPLAGCFNNLKFYCIVCQNSSHISYRTSHYQEQCKLIHNPHAVQLRYLKLKKKHGKEETITDQNGFKYKVKCLSPKDFISINEEMIDSMNSQRDVEENYTEEDNGKKNSRKRGKDLQNGETVENDPKRTKLSKDEVYDLQEINHNLIKLRKVVDHLQTETKNNIATLNDIFSYIKENCVVQSVSDSKIIAEIDNSSEQLINQTRNLDVINFIDDEDDD
jgi:hypothetical protein